MRVCGLAQAGSCSSRSGWTHDGLHPIKAVLLQMVSVTMNLAADLVEHCTGVGGGSSSHAEHAHAHAHAHEGAHAGHVAAG